MLEDFGGELLEWTVIVCLVAVAFSGSYPIDSHYHWSDKCGPCCRLRYDGNQFNGFRRSDSDPSSDDKTK